MNNRQMILSNVADLFQIQQEQYIVVVNYYSNYPEVVKLNSSSSRAVINALKSILGNMAYQE